MNKHHPNPHSKFFSSLKHLEKRLKLDTTTTTTTTSLSSHPSQSLSTSPLFLHHHPNNPSTTYSSQSQPPLEFLSNPTSLQPQQNDSDGDGYGDGDVDEVGLLVDLLDLSISDDEVDMGACRSCHCVDGFYDKVVGVKGPKCMKEAKRLDGWIRWLRNERVEPFRLAHLLLGKASLDGTEFPDSIHAFLQLDPPFSKDV